MRRRGWLSGARPQEIRFSRPPSAIPERGTPDTTTLRMDGWAPTLPRCAATVRTLTSWHLWTGDEARRTLGFWSPTDVSLIPLPAYDWVGNGTCRDRSAANGRGGDFIVYSDVKAIRRDPPDVVDIPAELSIAVA